MQRAGRYSCPGGMELHLICSCCSNRGQSGRRTSTHFCVTVLTGITALSFRSVPRLDCLTFTQPPQERCPYQVSSPINIRNMRRSHRMAYAGAVGGCTPMFSVTRDNLSGEAAFHFSRFTELFTEGRIDLQNNKNLTEQPSDSPLSDDIASWGQSTPGCVSHKRRIRPIQCGHFRRARK